MAMKPRFIILAGAMLAMPGFLACGSSSDGPKALREGPDQGAMLDGKLRRLERELRKQRAELRATEQRSGQASGSGGGIETEASKSFSELAGRLGGMVGVTIGRPGRGRVFSAGRLRSGSAWSTIKVPIALQLIEEEGGPENLTAIQRSEIRAALTASDNDAAAALFADLERRYGGIVGAANAVEGLLREAGDDSTRVSTRGRDGFSPYGQTDWSLKRQQLFMGELAGGCIGTLASRDYVLGLMGEVTSDSWGLGAVDQPARWKGGWGPGVDGHYLVRQMGIISVSPRKAVVTLAAIPEDGSFESAQAMATEVARWVAGRARRFAARSGSC